MLRKKKKAVKKTAKKMLRKKSSLLKKATKRKLVARVKKSGARKKPDNDRWKSFSWLLPIFLFASGALILKKNPSHGQRDMASQRAMQTKPASTEPLSALPVSYVSADLIEYFLKANELSSIESKVEFWSEKLLTKPNLLSSLASQNLLPKATPNQSQPHNDTAPLFPHSYDCTTYIETVGALSKSQSAEQIAQNLISIRYKDAHVSYVTRNHFPEADWIPNNIEAQNIQDITQLIARKSGLNAQFATKEVEKSKWFKTQYEQMGNEHASRAIAQNTEPVHAKLPYIPLHQFLSSIQYIPQGTIVNIVREDKKNHPVLISHQGFLIWKDGTAYFRHASRLKKITEVPLDQYLKQSSKMPWKVLGVNLNIFQNT